MADQKISDLAAGSRVRADDLFEAVQSAASKQVSAEELIPGPDLPPAAADALDDEFDDSETLPGGGIALWAWRNQGSASASISKSRCILLAPAVAGDNVRCLEQTAPANPWIFTCKFTPEFMGYPTNGMVGMFVLETATGKLVFLGLIFTGSTPSICVVNFTTVTAFSSVVTSAVRDIGSWYVQIEDNGTNLIYRFSKDGVVFTQLYSANRTVFLGGSADRIGICATSEQNVHPITGSFDWFRRDA